MFIVAPICENFMYSSLHVNEEFVIVAQCDGLSGGSVAWLRLSPMWLMAIMCQYGVGTIVAQGEWLGMIVAMRGWLAIGCQCGVGGI